MTQEQTGIKAALFQLISERGAADIRLLSSALHIEEPALRPLLDDLCREGQLVLTRKGRYAYPSLLGLKHGKVQGNRRGFGFLIPSDGGPDLFIAPGNLNGALHGDTVLARPLPGSRGECEVQTVLVRANDFLCGRFELDGPDAYVTPDDSRIHMDVRIPERDRGGARDGQKVAVRIVRYGGPNRSPTGRVVEVLGMAGEPLAERRSILRTHGLGEDFPANVLDEAARVPERVTEAEIAGRLDLREKTCFTIDGPDARDFDDAVSIERLDEGWRLGVHIADVSHYVRPGSLLDQEALRRGTSTYFPGLVLPMLPERLSNGICSLNPNEDRLAFSCIMDVNTRGEVAAYTITPSVIRSKARLVYGDVTRALETGEAGALSPLMPDLREMRALHDVLSARRRERGSLDLDVAESEIVLNEQGEPADIRRAEQGLANHMIEEFMLLANETVAAHARALELPFLYRVHEQPDPDKLRDLAAFLQFLGYSLKGRRGEGIHPKALQAILLQSQGRPEAGVIASVMLRALQKARYCPEDLGHFGLAARDYCHFTSPIRRYPDLFIHRVLKAACAGRDAAPYARNLDERARQCSENERRSLEAERDMDAMLKCRYMLSRVGEEADGLVTGVTSFGLFVTLENTVEGLIHVSALDDDYYLFDEKRYLLVGERTGRRYRLGQKVRVRVDGADMAARRVEFSPVRE